MPPAFGGDLKRYGASCPISPSAALQHRLPQVVPPVNSSLRATATIKSRAREEAEKYPGNVSHISAHRAPAWLDGPLLKVQHVWGGFREIPGTQHFVNSSLGGHSTLWVRLKTPNGAVPVAVVEMLPDGNMTAMTLQSAKHLRLSHYNAQPRKCSVPILLPWLCCAG